MIDSDSVKHFQVTINEDDLEKDVFHILRHVRPNWNFDDVKLKLLTDGITNKLMRCHEGVKEDDVVLVRVYGRKTDLFIDRTVETKNIILLHNQNLAPKLYGTFDNGLAYEYVPGRTLDRDNVTLPKIFLLVAAKMARLHLVTRNEMNHSPVIWDKIDSFYDLIPEKFTQNTVQKRFKKMNISKEKLLKEIKHLKEVLSKLSSPIVFCHNDLLLGNVIYNSDNETVTFIDFEYAGMNYQAFDIGNHFNEFAGVENIDYSRYPGRTFQTAWLYEYLRVYHGRDDVSFNEIDAMYVTVNKFGLLSHVLWGLWALIQAEHSTINFDFIKFASDHLKRYFDTKNEFLSLKPGQNKECQLKNCVL